MIYNQDEEENFLSDKRVEEKIPEQLEPRRRGGYYQENIQSENEIKAKKQDEKEESNVFNIVILAIAIVTILIAIFVMINIFKNETENDIPNGSTSGNTASINKNTNNTSKNNNSSNHKNSGSNANGMSISSISENYNIYPIKIESVVYKKGGNFYNNNEKIKGDKVYVEYKQISGLKDSNKQEKINKMLEKLSTDLYDKNYLSDKDTLFIDIHTKLSVNFNTLSYIVYKTGEDIEGEKVGETIKTLNIRLDTLEKIEFEKLFTDNANIKNMYDSYSKGKVDTFYFDPKNIYVYNNMKENKIDMEKNYSNIAIYKRYNDSSVQFTSNPVSKKVFTTLDSTVSEETKDRAFEMSK